MSKLNLNLDLYYLLAQMLGGKLSNKQLTPGQLVEHWTSVCPTVQELVSLILLQLLGIKSNITSSDEFCRAYICGILSLDGIPIVWLHCLSYFYLKELTRTEAVLEDIDGKLFTTDQVLLELDMAKPELHCLALSALRFDGLYRFRLVEVVTFRPSKRKHGYDRDEVRLISLSFNPKVVVGPGIGKVYLGELVARDGICYFIYGNESMHIELHADVNAYLASLTLGRARARHKTHGLYLEWVEIDNDVVATTGLKLL